MEQTQTIQSPRERAIAKFGERVVKKAEHIFYRTNPRDDFWAIDSMLRTERLHSARF